MAGIPTYPTRQGRAVHRVSRDRVAEQHGRGEQGRSGLPYQAGQGNWAYAVRWGRATPVLPDQNLIDALF